MVALFHGVPLIIDLIWAIWSKYVRAAVEHYRIQRSIRTKPKPMDVEIGVESAMPHIFKPSTPTQSGGNSTRNGQKTDGKG